MDIAEWPVRIECSGTLSDQFDTEELAHILPGTANSVSEFIEGGKKWIKVIFNEEANYKKALLLNGRSVNGTTFQVSPMSVRLDGCYVKPKAKVAKTGRGTGSRRNLYVLNLPHDLTPQDYRNLFTPHGTPTHTVLLKTHDSCSRRRGFVVMSTHEEAQEVIKWLDGICIRGFQIKVTWANIDRSNGFLSGYDRFPLDNLSAYPPTNENSTTGLDTSTVVASNIPIALFPSSEVDILFKPFGQIKRIQIVPPNPPTTYPLATLAPASPLAQTAIVTYDNARNAIAAKNTLHGQCYEGFTLAVGFVFNLDQGKNNRDGLGVSAFPKAPLGVSTNTFPRYRHTLKSFSNLSGVGGRKDHQLFSQNQDKYLFPCNENIITWQRLTCNSALTTPSPFLSSFSDILQNRNGEVPFHTSL